MAKNTQPIAKRCKALGLSPAVLGYAKKTTERGSANQQRKKKSEYATQLNEKQKVKFVYGMLEKQFRSYYQRAERMPGKAGENLLVLCERRLDNVVYRLGFANSRNQARQLVRHGLFTLNGHKVNIPSIQLRVGDSVEIPEKNRQVKIFADAQETIGRRGTPNWLEADYDAFKGTVKAMPQREDIRTEVNEQLIVELYSK